MNSLIEKSIFEVLKSPMAKLVSEIGEEIKQIVSNKLLEYQVKEYEQNIYVKTLLFGDEPKPLYEVYQNLNIRKVNKEKPIYTDSIKKVFKQEKFITILGDAGSGKSMLVKHLFTKAVDENFRYPIKVELRYLNKDETKLVEYISNEYFKFHDLSKSDRIISRLLHSGRFVFFFDGYDEIKLDRRETITYQLQEFIKKYDKNKYIITSRPHTGIENFPLFHNYYIQAFKEEEIEEFVKKQLKHKPSIASDIIKSVNKIENKAYKSYLYNPLLLTMFILSYNTYSDLPPRRSVFYRQVFDTLFIIHDTKTKSSYKRERVSGLSRDQFETVLKIFSFLTFFEYKMMYSKEDMYTLFNKIKGSKREIEFDNDGLIEDLTISIGIMVKEGLEYAFSHRSLQEYFAALYISSLREEHKKIIYNKLKRKLLDEKYIWIEYYANFCLLLSELDVKFMLKEFLLPTLEYFEKTVSPEKVMEMESDKKLSKFFKEKSWVLNIFFSNDADFEQIKIRQHSVFNKIYELEEKSVKMKNKEKLIEESMNSILTNEIIPLLSDYHNLLIHRIDKIREQINDENEGDIEILSMI